MLFSTNAQTFTGQYLIFLSANLDKLQLVLSFPQMSMYRQQKQHIHWLSLFLLLLVSGPQEHPPQL